MIVKGARDPFAWLAAAVYALLFTVLGAARYAVHRNLVDFGIFAQTVSSAFGCFCNQIEGSHWAYHFSPILYAVAAVVWMWRSPLALVAVQAIAGALVIPPVYGLVARRADRSVARLAALVVALYPALSGLVFLDFHENGFAPAAVAWMLWAFDGEYIALTCAFAAVTLCIKEDQAIFLAIAGVLGAWRYRGSRMGTTALALALAGTAVAVVFFLIIQPHAAAVSTWSPTRFYAWTGSDLNTLAVGLLGRAGFMLLAFGPLLLLCFRSNMMWLAAAPLAEVLLSRMSTTYTLGTHYAGAWIGYALVAFAFAIREEPVQRATRLLLVCLVLCCLELAVANPLHPGMNLRAVQSRDVALDRVLASLPSNISVATQEEAFTHLALRDPNARELPENPSVVPDACFALVDLDYPRSVILLEYGSAFEQLVRNGTYRSIQHTGGIELYRRATPCR